MEETWYSFPAQLGEHQGFIACNYSFGEIAEQDSRNQHLVVRVGFKQPDENGLPTPAEYPALKEVDEKLGKLIVGTGGIYVGRITVDNHRYFHYYINLPEQQVMDMVQQVATETDYELQYIVEQDTDKTNYWEEIYPTLDDWQVIRDLKVLDVLAENEDNNEIEREVLHWAYFDNETTAKDFTGWLNDKSYDLKHLNFDADNGHYVVHFTHVGTMALSDISSHSIHINRKVNELEGEYDGWETSVEKG